MIVLAISGPSCCGKSTLARHLRHVLPNAAMLYEDDFYRPEMELPLDSNGQPNWDSPQAFDLEAMHKRVQQLKSSNKLPEQDSREEKNNNEGVTFLSESEVAQIREEVNGCGEGTCRSEPVLILDGILLFHKESPLWDLFDVKIVCPFEVETLKKRRSQRVGYSTPDNKFWADPPNYFEDLVWPEFVKYCGYLYEHEGQVYDKLAPAAKERGISIPPTQAMRGMVEFVAEQLAKANR